MIIGFIGVNIFIFAKQTDEKKKDEDDQKEPKKIAPVIASPKIKSKQNNESKSPKFFYPPSEIKEEEGVN